MSPEGEVSTTTDQAHHEINIPLRRQQNLINNHRPITHTTMDSITGDNPDTNSPSSGSIPNQRNPLAAPVTIFAQFLPMASFALYVPLPTECSVRDNFSVYPTRR